MSANIGPTFSGWHIYCTILSILYHFWPLFCLFSKFSLIRGQKELLLFHYLTFNGGCCCRCYLIAASKHRIHPLSKYHCRQIKLSWITFLLDLNNTSTKHNCSLKPIDFIFRISFWFHLIWDFKHLWTWDIDWER